VWPKPVRAPYPLDGADTNARSLCHHGARPMRGLRYLTEACRRH
jgi:hypothetical protein